ncbi:hypothetical protein D3C73_893290 [compost metagenome]
MEPLGEAQFGLVAQARGMPGHGVHHGGRGAGGVLRVQRHGQDALATGRAQAGDRVWNGRVAIAHAQFDHGVDTRHFQRGAHAVRLPSAVNHERRAVLQPNAGIARRELLGTQGQHQPMQNGLPEIAGDFNDAGVGQELAQVFADAWYIRSIRRAKVDQQHPDLARRACGRVFVEGVVLLGFRQVAFRPQILEQAKKHKNSPSSARRM